jgi:hypothetical protein
MPEPGEDPSSASIWPVHAASRVVELLAGRIGEAHACREAKLDNATDRRLAEIYAATLCQPSAVPSYLHWARCEAAEILERYWFIVQALAEALEARKTLDGTEIDTIIATAVCEAALRAEKARRAQQREAERRAALFLKETRPDA